MRDQLNVDRTVRISIYQVIAASSSNVSSSNATTLHRNIDSKMVSLDATGWETFDVTALMTQWWEEPSSNQGLLVICDSQPLSEVISFVPAAAAAAAETQTVPGATAADVNLPVFDVYTQKQRPQRRRKRRSLDALEKYDCKRDGRESRCCRYPLYIDFAEIGYDWIQQPAGFWASYCDGSCPRDYKVAHNFAPVQSRMHAITKYDDLGQLNPYAVPEPCCSPSRLSPLPVMYFNEDGMPETGVLSDMIIDECHCS